MQYEVNRMYQTRENGVCPNAARACPNPIRLNIWRTALTIFMIFSVWVALIIVFWNPKTICPKKFAIFFANFFSSFFDTFSWIINEPEFFFKNRALSLLSPYDYLPSGQKWAKSLEPFLRYGQKTSKMPQKMCFPPICDLQRFLSKIGLWHFCTLILP